jgi:hypothetical protein
MRLYDGDPVENMKLFNSDSNYKVLIANELPPAIPLNINHFHIIDTKLDVAFALVDILYKNNNYTTQPPPLDIHLYYMLNNKEGSKMTYESYDFRNFKLALNKIQSETIDRWNYEYAYKVFNPNSIMMVEMNKK